MGDHAPETCADEVARERFSEAHCSISPDGFFTPGIKALPRNIPPIPFGVKKFVCSVEVDEALGDGAVSALCLRLIQAVVGTLDEVVDRLRSLKGHEAG
jgi:hypothetical protein